MKYGDTLRQRSIPEWGYFNIDYDFLKDLIKHHTTPGAGTAVSIPGQGDTTERAFSETFLKVLRAQHDRINLFIKSKRGEIERRLDHANARLHQIQERQLLRQSEGVLRAKTIERYAKIDADVSKAGEEIRCLARFRVAQCTGFYKILKKYKRWTNDQELENRFKAEVTGSHDSFFQLDLGYLLDQYIDVLHAVRAPFEQANTPLVPDREASADATNAIIRMARAIDHGSELDFDSTISAASLGSDGSKATYWIHADHVLETEVLLLQYMRLHNPVRSRPHSQHSLQATSPRSSISRETSASLVNEDEIGVLVFDNPEHFAQKNKSIAEGNQEKADAGLASATGYARWSSAEDVAAVYFGGELDREHLHSGVDFVPKLRRKQLYPLLSAVDHIAGQSEPLIDDLTDLTTQFFGSMSSSAIDIFEKLATRKEAKPLVGICAKRTRFVGLQNCPTGCVWATLDRDIDMKSGMLEDLKQADWSSAARKNAAKFPHVVLEIRGEGRQAGELIQILDRSHLLERVRGFSLEVHAVWTCCKPPAIPEPFWIPTLEKDIRKLPDPVRRRRRKPRSTQNSISSTPPLTSASTSSVTDGQQSSSTLRRVESSATSGPELPVPTPQSVRKKSTRSYSKFAPRKVEQTLTQQRYWNEYDDPESEEEGYYIYVNPDEEVKFPGQETIEKWAKKTKQLFRTKSRSERSPLLSVPESPTCDGETTDESVNGSAATYGTMGRSRPHEGYFSSIFRSLRDPHRDAQTIASLHRQSEHERRGLVSIIEMRQHEREMTKLRLYVTCIVAAVVIDIILLALAFTSRRKTRGVVDSVILFGTISNLLLLVVALLSMKTRRERLGWVHQGFVLLNVVAVVVVDVLLFDWVFSP